MCKKRILLLIVIVLMLKPELVLSSDIRLSGMGGSIAIRDFENDAFGNPAILTELNNHIIIAGLGAKYSREYYGYYSQNADTVIDLRWSSYRQEYSPTMGFMLPLKRSGTSFAALWIGNYINGRDYDDNDITDRYSSVNLRVAQKIGQIGLGIGYYEMLYNNIFYPKKQIIFGIKKGENENNISSSLFWEQYGVNSIAYNFDLKWQQRMSPWLHTTALGGFRFSDNDVHQYYTYYLNIGIDLAITPIRANIYGDAYLKYKDYYHTDYTLNFNVGNFGLERQITPIWTMRMGCKLNASPREPYSIIYDRPEYTIGTTLDIGAKIEYACNFWLTAEHHNHYLKLIYSW